jgi:hypothetical protein
MHRPLSGPRKRRTREHVIGEMGVNHVERQALKCGYAVERVTHDYGIDLFLFTYDDNGETEAGWIPLQVKATDAVRTSRDGRFVSIRVDRADLRSWIIEAYPVILIVYDAKRNRAYWLYIQEHFAESRFRISSGSDRTSIHIPVKQVLNSAAIRRIRGLRDEVLARWKERSERDD